MDTPTVIRTPDQRLRVFVSSTLRELADERRAIRRAIHDLRLTPIMFESGARPHPPQELYRAYLAQSHVFIGCYGERYGWVAPGESVSGLEDEYRRAQQLPRLIYVREPTANREPRLAELLRLIRHDNVSYRRFTDVDELRDLVRDDLALLLSERFESGPTQAEDWKAGLPAPLTHTIGREREITEVAALLGGDTRLLTITGAGGIGKTRLAVAVGREVDARYRDGAGFVTLSAAHDEADASRAIAAALGLRPDGNQTSLQALIESARSRHSLLILDNLEQITDVHSVLVALLEAAPHMDILATSREALRVRGEREFRLHPLQVPGSDDSWENIVEAPAVRLFVDRARDLRPDFALDDDNAASIAELCRRVDGLPLAIEVAAGQLRLLQPDTLLDRFDDLLAALAYEGTKDLPPRQRTLRAAIEWSYDLLDDDERALFAGLSVFRSGATLQAIVNVAGHLLDPTTTLAALLDKSLIEPDSSAPGDPRFTMLETVRVFAADKLAHEPAGSDWKHQHLRYFADLARRAQPYLCGPHQRQWLDRLDPDRDNLRVAVDRGIELGEVGTALQVVWDTFVYFYVRDSFADPRRWVEDLRRRPASLDAVGDAKLTAAAAIVGLEPPSPEQAVTQLEDIAGVFADHGLRFEQAVTEHYLGLARWNAGDRSGAEASLIDASRRYGSLGHHWGIATVETTLGAMLGGRGDLDAAREHNLRSLDNARAIDNRPQITQALQSLALIDALRGHIGSARERLAEAVNIVLTDHAATAASYCLEAAAAIAAAEADDETAVRALGLAAKTREWVRAPAWTAAADLVKPVVDTLSQRVPAPRLSHLWRQGQRLDPFGLLADFHRPRTAGPGEPSSRAHEPALSQPLHRRVG